MSRERRRIFRFGPFELDAARRLLRVTDRNEPIALTPRLIDPLLVLVENAGQVVEKRALLDAVWPNVIVEENNLTQAVSALRKALGERPGEQRYIATVPGRGYRFVAEVAVTGHDPGTEAPVGAAVPRPPADALAPTHRDWSFRPRPAGVWLGLFVLAAVLGVLLFDAMPLPQPESGARAALLASHQRISAPDGDHAEPALSPDGSLVAFVSDATGSPQIWIQSLTHGDAVPITFDDSVKSAPTWSRDDRILYTKHREDGAPVEIWWVDALGTLQPQLLISPGAHASLSYDGSEIAFERGRQIWLADADGSNQRPVEGVPQRGWIGEWTRPALSPDGELIAFYLQAVGPVGDFQRRYGLLAARLDYDLPGGKLRVGLFGTNLTDEYYFTSHVADRNSGFDPATVGRPRELGVGFRLALN